ncbi:hypothetical protein BJ912DRAFT_929147 [Pholiota molesta]|nr:hypothetical protein BJ912DRAFT_929147 [Pholiota molesta]
MSAPRLRSPRLKNLRNEETSFLASSVQCPRLRCISNAFTRQGSRYRLLSGGMECPRSPFARPPLKFWEQIKHANHRGYTAGSGIHVLRPLGQLAASVRVLAIAYCKQSYNIIEKCNRKHANHRGYTAGSGIHVLRPLRPASRKRQGPSDSQRKSNGPRINRGVQITQDLIMLACYRDLRYYNSLRRELLSNLAAHFWRQNAGAKP